MGLFKSDKDILAEGKALYIKGDLAGAYLKLLKLKNKGYVIFHNIIVYYYSNEGDEAHYWASSFSLL